MSFKIRASSTPMNTSWEPSARMVCLRPISLSSLLSRFWNTRRKRSWKMRKKSNWLIIDRWRERKTWAWTRERNLRSLLSGLRNQLRRVNLMYFRLKVRQRNRLSGRSKSDLPYFSYLIHSPTTWLSQTVLEHRNGKFMYIVQYGILDIFAFCKDIVRCK